MDEELEKIRERKEEELSEKPGYPKEPIEVNAGNFNEALRRYSPLVVDCWAPWCIPCRLVEPVVKELSREYAGKVVFGKLNVDENRAIAMKFGIQLIPTLLIFKEEKLVDSIIGAVPKEEAEARILHIYDGD